MATSRIEYKGNLRTECTHLQSNSIIITDAPVDNNGKGEAFSPTDLVATSYVSCMLTIIGIYCEKNEIPLVDAYGEVKKIMAPNPRRISKLNIYLDFKACAWEEKIQQKIVRVAETCPVAKSIHPDIEVEINYAF